MSLMKIVAVLVAVVAAVGAVFLLSEPAAPRTGPLRVAATTGMIADTARVIGGARAGVTGLMGQGVDPHLYKASPTDVRVLTQADLILYNGLHLEGRMADLFVRLARRQPTVQVTETIPEELLRQPPEFAGHFDPHVWFDVSLWMKTAERVRDALTEVDPEGGAEYAANADKHLAEMAALHEWCKTELARVPAEKRVLVTAHDAFGYFGRAYGLEVLGIQGISTDSEPSIQDINRLVDLLVTRKVGAVFVESSVPPKTIEALVEGARSRGHTVVIGGELFSDAMGRDGTPEGTYIGMVRHNVTTIVRALLGEQNAGDAGAETP
ncbi:MAG: metal ABC transporter solute-binding protein, Zn/Mn family [Phycisphaerales bacterium]